MSSSNVVTSSPSTGAGDDGGGSGRYQSTQQLLQVLHQDGKKTTVQVNDCLNTYRQIHQYRLSAVFDIIDL